MKVLQLASGDLWAGAEAQLHALSRSLHRDPGVSLMVVLLNDGELAARLRRDNIDTVILDERHLSTFALVRGLVRISHSFVPDVIHTHRQKENVIGAIAARLCGNIPSLRTVHGANEHTKTTVRGRFKNILDSFVAKHLQEAIVAVSRELQNELRSRLNRNVEFIANGIDDRFFLPHNRKQDQFKSSRIAVGFAGRLVPVKRIDLFLDIANRATLQYAGRFEFHIFGDGPELDRTKSRVEELGLADVVTLHGFITDMMPMLAMMDLLLISSDHEGLPMVVLEAATLGVPIVSRRVGEIPAVLKDGNAGHLIDDADPDAFVESLGDYLDNPICFKQKAQLAKDNVKRNFTARACAKRYRALYQQLISQRLGIN